MTAQTAKPNSESDEKGIASGIFVTIKGRILSSKKISTKNGYDFVQTTIVMAAKDAYSHPSTFAVNSDAKLGSDGTDVIIPCELRPYSRTRNGEKYFNLNLWATN